MKKRLTTQEFIEKAKKIHNNKYDYSKVEYINDRTKVCIICPIHGEFWQTPNNHYKKGCKKCANEINGKKRRLTLDEFISKANKIHNNKYDYSKVEYINNSTKVCIICPKHGEFFQTPSAHLKGQDCPKCVHRSKKYTTEEWVEKAKKIHNNKYDYSKVNYINSEIKVCIICPKHGEFWQIPTAHINKQGCPKCADISNGEKRKLGTNKFIEIANKIHNNKYDYSKVEYINNSTKVCIICPKHGEFWQTPLKHLIGQGCPVCNESILENKMKAILNENKIKYEYQHRTNWLTNANGNVLSLDFYLPLYNIAIECQGIQHFKMVERFGGKKMFDIRIMNDALKNKLCLEHDIKILYVVKNKVETSLSFYNENNVMLIDEFDIEKIIKANE